MPVRKKRGGLKFLAGTCIFSAWLTLVVSILGAIGAFTSGAGLAQMAAVIPAAVPLPSSPGSGALPGGSDGLGGSGDEGLGLPSSGLGVPGMPGAGGANPLASMLSTFLPALCFAGGVFTLVTGIVTFLIFLGLGQACYALLDLEEQTFQISQTLQLVLARLGVGR